MNQVIVYLVVLLTISSPVVFGAFDDLIEDIDALEPITSASTEATSTSTTTIRSTSTTSPTKTSSSTSSSTSTTSKPNSPNSTNIFQGSNTNRPSGGLNNPFQFLVPVQGFPNIERISNDLVQKAAKQSLQPMVSHFQRILMELITDPNDNDELISTVQRTLDNFNELVTDAPNLRKAENVAKDIQTRKFIKQLSQPFDQIRNIFNLRL